TGGDGPPLLLVHGWPQTWYAWRMLMPVLARDFSVVAVDQRGIGLSDKPQDGYDSATLAADLVALMDALGYSRFPMYGTDDGMPIAYALAADHPDRLDRLAVSEAPSRGYLPHRPCPPTAAQRAAVAPRLLPALQGERAARHRTGRHLLRRGVRRLGRDEQAARLGGQALHRHPRLQPRPPARQLRVLPRDPHQQRAERARQDRAAAPAGPGDRRSGEFRCSGWEHDEAGRGGRAEPGHSGRRPLGRRAGAGGAAARPARRR